LWDNTWQASVFAKGYTLTSKALPLRRPFQMVGLGIHLNINSYKTIAPRWRNPSQNHQLQLVAYKPDNEF
jgi:hypothetical protein